MMGSKPGGIGIVSALRSDVASDRGANREDRTIGGRFDRVFGKQGTGREVGLHIRLAGLLLISDIVNPRSCLDETRTASVLL